MSGALLVIDDSAAVRRQIIKTLRGKSLFDRYLEARDGIEGFKMLGNFRVDLILCDLEMPRMDGFKFLSLINSHDQLKTIPVIMLSAHGQDAMRIRGLEQGAVDFVTKPFIAGELLARVNVQLKVKRLQDELRQSNERLKELSNTDFLTGLYNRRFIMDVLKLEFQRMRRKKGHLSLIILDIDHFKRINDAYGHPQGDQVLVRIAELLRVDLRPYDVAARFGGEEFVILLPETRLDQSVEAAERLRKKIAAAKFPPPLQDLALTVSLGVASCPEMPIESIHDLIKAADDGLYRAKECGRNRIGTMDETGEGKSVELPFGR